MSWAEKFSWAVFVAALGLFVVLVGLAVWTAGDPKLATLHAAMVKGAELGIGALFALLGSAAGVSAVTKG